MPSPSKIIVEACVGNFADGLLAVELGADRVEFCRQLEVGGLTPDFEQFQRLRSAVDFPIVTLIRPRGGDFFYSDYEWRRMLSDAKRVLDLGADGIVFGVLNAENDVDVDRTSEMIDLVRRYPGRDAVVHRAFDESSDIWKSWADLKELGIDRILTAGGKKLAAHGCENLQKLEVESQEAGGRPSILVCGSVRAHNVLELLRRTKARQIHSACIGDQTPIRLDPGEFQKLISAVREFELPG